MLQFSDKFLEHIDDNKGDSVTKFFTGLPGHAVFMWMETFTTCILPKSKVCVVNDFDETSIEYSESGYCSALRCVYNSCRANS